MGPIGEWLPAAIGLVFIIEGLLPFASPATWRSTFEKVLSMSDGQIRFIGLASVAAGLVVLWVSR